MSTHPVAVVTGAGSGIGRCIARQLAAEGHRVALVGRTESKLRETVALMVADGASSDRTLILPADLANTELATRVIDDALAHWNAVDVLINNAAIAQVIPIADSSPSVMQETFAANLFSAATLVWRVWPSMVARGSGCIGMVSSIAAHDPFPGFFAYAASKAAMESLARSIANEGRRVGPGSSGIRSFCVAPGAVETPMLRSGFSTAVVPTSRTLTPDAVARTVVDAVLGRAAVKNGGTILMPSP